MKFRIEITCDNAAFHDDDRADAGPARGRELGRILRRLGHDLADEPIDLNYHRTLFDVNGNNVGHCEMNQK